MGFLLGLRFKLLQPRPNDWKPSRMSGSKKADKKGGNEKERRQNDSPGAAAAEEKESGVAGAGDAEELAEDSSRDMQQQSKALDSITDHVEERQLDSRRVEQVRPRPWRSSSLSCALILHIHN